MTAVESGNRLRLVSLGTGTWLSHTAHHDQSRSTGRHTARSGNGDPTLCPNCRRPLPDPGQSFQERATARGLTRRETQVMELIGQGRTNKDIVEALGLSANTVKSYIRTAYRRLDVESRSEAVLWANGVEIDRSEPGR